MVAKSMFADEQRITYSPEVLSRILEGEAVLLNLESGTYFGLNQVATRLWELIGQGKNVKEIRDELLQEFDVPEDVLDRDLRDILLVMHQRGLICADGAESGSSE